jgi:hypothetical protein
MTESDRPPFWAEKAQRMVGKSVLVGITYVTHDGRPDGQRQFHGVIEQADQRRGFAVRVNPETLEWLPPHPAAFSAAAPGEYRLQSTGELVTDPDLLATWTIRRPAPQEGSPPQPCANSAEADPAEAPP